MTNSGESKNLKGAKVGNSTPNPGRDRFTHSLRFQLLDLGRVSIFRDKDPNLVIWLGSIPVGMLVTVYPPFCAAGLSEYIAGFLDSLSGPNLLHFEIERNR